MRVGEQVWMTAAVDDATAAKALVLGRSIRRSVTSRRLAIVVSKPVSEEFRKLLGMEFDQVLQLDKMSYFASEMNGLPLIFHSKLFCWGLPFVNRVVFLHPNDLVVRNADELFDIEGDNVAFEGDGCVQVIKPDLQVFENILAAVREHKIHSGDLVKAERELAVWLHEQGRLVVGKGSKYCVPITASRSVLACNEGNVSICRFMDFHPCNQNLPQNIGVLEQAVCSLWREIAQDVQYKGKPEKMLVEPRNDIPDDFSGVQEPVAIVGISCRFPGADSLEEYWQLLLEGRDCIQKVPEHRWPSAKSQEFREVQAGFLKCPVDSFDGKFFGISPADLMNTDPQQRLLLEVVWEALEDAAINPKSLKGTPTGVFVGSWTSDYRDLINNGQNNNIDSELTEFHRLYMGNSLGGTGGRLSYLLGLTGPNVATESGCSSGMVAIYLATESLRSGRCKTAIAGGVNLLLHPFKRKHMQSIIAPDGRCKTFDERADGFGRGEGVASLILKKYSDALKDGDRVYALIRGTGVSQEGTSRSFGTPTKECQELAMLSALHNAGLQPNEVCYVEAHGTGTMVGDPVEMAAITKVYSKDRVEPLIVSSGKTNIGHTESCSGFAGIIKVILAMQHNLIPPHLHLEKVNPHIDLDAIPAIVPLQLMEWKRGNKPPRIAGVSSFGITGTDAHIILQEPPQCHPPRVKMGLERPLHLLTFSSKSEQGLDAVLNKYADFVEENVQLNIGDVANTANTGRAHFAYRVAVIAKDLPDAVKKMRNCVGGLAKHIPEKPPKLCFLFTGQGSQYEGMAKSLYDTCPIFRMNFDKCSHFLEERFNLDLKCIMWPSTPAGGEQLKRSLFSQTAIFCVEYALTQLWLSWGLVPDMVLGHSLGEFAAAVCAGMLTLEDALVMVAERSRLIEGQKKGSMLVVKADKATVNKLLHNFFTNNLGWLDLAAVNSAEQTVVAGPQETVQHFSTFLSTKNVKSTVLEATNAFHSRDMDPMLEQYRAVVSKVQFKKPKDGIQYISGLKGEVMSSMDENYWVDHTREAVQFREASICAWREEARVFVEVGPQPVLSALTMGNVGDLGGDVTFLPSLRRKEEEWSTLLNTVAKLYISGFDLNWVNFEQFYGRSKISLPFYPFHRKSYWYNQGKSEEGGAGALTFNSANVLHPLVGHNFPNATNMKIYQGTVNGERFPYLKDHCIGGKVIFPGAGYLEMCLAAGNASTSIQLDNERVHMSANPVAIDNLTIEAPLCVDETVHMQTTADCTSAETSIAVYTLRQKKWVRQATATFSPLPMTFVPDESQVSKEPFLDILQRLTPADVNIQEFYDKLAEVGLQFGPIFRSIKKIWKGGDRELVCEVDVPEGSEEYLVHPVVLDALIQSIMVGMERKVDSLFVPISIARVVVFSQKAEGAGNKLYAHCHWSSGGEADSRSAVLYDDTGKLLAFMSGVQMIETSVLQILKALDHQKLSLPGMYEEAWKPKTGIWKNRTNMKAIARDYLFSNDFYEKVSSYNNVSDEKKRCKRLREELVFVYGLRSLYDMGWCSPPIGGFVDLHEFMQKYGVLKSHDKLMTRLFNIMTEEGLFERTSKTVWKVIKKFPDESQVHQQLRELHTELMKEGKEGVPWPEGSTPTEPEDVRVMSACGEQLSKILQGKASALPILFPEDRSSEVSADSFYNNTPLLWGGGRNLMQMILRETFSHWVELPEEERGVMRILEVGAGTGSSTKIFLECLEEFGIKYQYTFSDISPAFFIRASPMLESYGKKINYKVLNIEEDPLSQGYVPATFDIVFGSNVIHATKHLEETMTNIRHLLRDSGLFMMIETFQPNRDIDIVFGVLEGYWRFSDLNLRPEHPFLDADKWCDVIARTGHSKVQKFYCYDFMNGGIIGKASDILPLYKPPQLTTTTGGDKVWMVFGTHSFDSQLRPMFVQSGRKPLLVSRGNLCKIEEERVTLRPSVKEDMDAVFRYLNEKEIALEGILYMWGIEQGADDPLSVTHPFLFLAQSLISDYKGLPRLIIATEGIIPVTDQSSVGVSQGSLWGMARSFRSEHSNMFVRCIDLDPDEADLSLKYKELWAEMWFDDYDYQVAYRQRSRHVCRFVVNKDVMQPLSLPNSERFSLVLPQTRNINDLTFCANGKPMLKEGQIEVQVKCLGLNFRDVFVVLKPDKAFEKYNTVGLEFAGVVNSLGPNVTNFKIGDPVVGCNFTGDALPSHAVCNSDLVIPMPQGLTFQEACTLPAAFGTAYYCLVTVANLQKGETVLIHAGSGGVGLYAIQVAQALGAEIITTAGSRRKRAYLRSLGVKHVFHSRNTDYGHQIKELSMGVDVVLNCLTSPGFKEASLGACNKGARFVEISKMAIWTEEEVAELRPDVKYWIIDLTVVTSETWTSLWNGLNEFWEKGYLKPIPYVKFDAQHIREALMYMQKAKHIGKVLVTMPEPNCTGQSDPKTHMFNEVSSYLITGGLGGIGLEVAKWMTESGAQHVVLVSRREPNERAAKMIAEMTEKGKHIVVKQLDVGDFDQCRELISNIQKGGDGLPPLRGVMHAAGSLSDATFTNQTMDTYDVAFRGKVQGAWNLHKLTTELDCRLEHFILYSSIVAIFGPIGLSNYAAANTFLDALAHFRNSVGLTAQTINWGQWAEVGAAANIHITAIRAFTPSQGIAALEAVMKSLKPQSCILEVDFSALRKWTGHAVAYLEEMKISKDSHSATFNIKMEHFWDEYNGAQEDKRGEVIKSYIEMILRQILKFDEDEPIDENQNFSEMGMDSLMMLEMKNLMQTMLGKGVTMNVSAMQELTTVVKLVAHLQELIANMGQEESHGPVDYDIFQDELIALINKDMMLPDHLKIKEGMLPPPKRSQVKSVLLTGVTGKFGPFMLRSILRKKDIEKVVCVIRSKVRDSAKERFKNAFEPLDMMREVDMSKVELVTGDIAERHFGMSEREWENLSNKVDAVVHCAVKGNLLDPYTRFSKDGNVATKGTDIRTANVIGSINVMELCVTGKQVKPLFFASTLLANQKTNEKDKSMWEEWYVAEEVFQLKNTGYPVSKFVCEVLLKQLGDVGVPVGVYRFPALFGDSRTGRFTLQNNHAMMRLLGFCKLGAIPAIPLPIQVLPSDLAADMSLDVFWNDSAPLGVYNITNPILSYFHELPKVSGEIGFPMEVVEWEVFAQKLADNEEYKTLFPQSEVDMDEGRYVDFSTSAEALTAWIKNPEGYFLSKRLLQFIPDLYKHVESPLSTLKRDLQYAIDSGICAKFGIKKAP